MSHYKCLLQDRIKQKKFHDEFDPAKARCVALGKGYVVVEEGGYTFWSRDNPQHLLKILQSLGRKIPDYVVIGPGDQVFLRFGDNSVYYVASASFGAAIQNSNKVPDRVAFGPDSSWFILWHDGSMSWDKIPKSMYNKLNGRNNNLPSLTDVSISPIGAWFVMFEDGCWEAYGVSDLLEQDLRKVKEEGGYVDYLVFGETESYVIGYTLHDQINPVVNNSGAGVVTDYNSAGVEVSNGKAAKHT
eukprot:TRINITY_DN1310_c0_g1_i1.p1 TRINITY_DN1310_c0_g1~~TRINITY_DN1310_c0_g1_i1.p1  ORF type:complete len:244 (-),score=14.37 TRINITY_DN1310_c0_g1_i1:1349-2080(-)